MNEEQGERKRGRKRGVGQDGSRTIAKKQAMLAALVANLGNVTRSAKAAGCTKESHYNWMRLDKEYKKAVDDIQYVEFDYVQHNLHKQIGDGVSASTIYWLKTKGTKFGYGDPAVKRLDGVNGSGIESKHYVEERLALSRLMTIGLVIDRIAAKQNIPADYFWYRLFSSWYAQHSGFATSQQVDTEKLQLPSSHVFNLEDIKQKHLQVTRLDEERFIEFKKSFQENNKFSVGEDEDSEELSNVEKLKRILSRKNSE